MNASNAITIDGREIGPGCPPYVIAEISANHNGSIDTAHRLIDEAKRAGADAVKLQTYRPDTITLDSDDEQFRIRGGLWDGMTLYELYSQAYLPWDWHAPLFAHARDIGISIFSSPFDETAVDLLQDLGAPAFKIASFEAVDLPLIEYVARAGKPMIISTGMADDSEIGEALAASRQGGCQEVAILHCVSGYPAPAVDYNLRTIPDMARRFGVVTGLSDHTIGNATAVCGVACGASIIEKHFTLDRSAGGPDDSFSMEPEDLAALCRDVRIAWEALGTVDYGRKTSESGNLMFRRSLYFVRDLAAGEVITADSIRSVRPGFGAPPKSKSIIIGKCVRKAVRANTPVNLDDIY